MKTVLILAALFASVLTAADISGNWKGTAEGPNGTIERTFAFKQEGTKLTGETSSDYTGQSKITDGKVEGDSITFSITAKIQDNEMKLTYKGKITGEEITFDVVFPAGDRPTIKYVVKRAK